MKKILLLITFFTFINCSSQQKEEEFIKYSCECISEIPKNENTSELMIEASKCIALSSKKYADYIEDVIEKYLKGNPNSEYIDAQNWMKKELSEKLVRQCPRFNKILSKVAYPKVDSSTLIKRVANNICKEIDNLGDTELTWKKIDPIIIKQWDLHYEEIEKEYGKKDSEIEKFGSDIVKELVVNCNKYRSFTLKKNK